MFLITKTWGEFPTAEEVKAAGVWDDNWFMELKGIDHAIADLAGVDPTLRTKSLGEFLEAVRRIVTVAELDENVIKEKCADKIRYSPAQIKDETSSLASSMMQVGVGIEWI
jgi:hypothetical protein